MDVAFAGHKQVGGPLVQHLPHPVVLHRRATAALQPQTPKCVSALGWSSNFLRGLHVCQLSALLGAQRKRRRTASVFTPLAVATTGVGGTPRGEAACASIPLVDSGAGVESNTGAKFRSAGDRAAGALFGALCTLSAALHAWRPNPELHAPYKSSPSKAGAAAGVCGLLLAACFDRPGRGDGATIFLKARMVTCMLYTKDRGHS